MTAGESKGTQVSGASWSASDHPEGKLDSVAIHSPLLLFCIVLKVVVKQWRVPAFSKGGLQTSLSLWRSPLPSRLHASVSHEVSPWSKFPNQRFRSLQITLDFAHVEQWVRSQGTGWGVAGGKLPLPVACTSFSSQEKQRGADVSIDDPIMSDGTATPKCQTAGPEVSVSEAPTGAYVPVFYYSNGALASCCATDTGTSPLSSQTASILFLRATKQGCQMSFYIVQALASTISGSGSNKTQTRMPHSCACGFPHSSHSPFISPIPMSRTTHLMRKGVVYNWMTGTEEANLPKHRMLWSCMIKCFPKENQPSLKQLLLPSVFNQLSLPLGL